MIPCKDISFVEWTLKVRNFLTLSVMESQKAAEDRQNKEILTDSRGFFPRSRNKQSFLIFIQAKYYCHMINPSLSKREVKMVEY